MYEIYIVEKIGYNEYRSQYVETIDNIEQVEDKLAEYRSQGYNAYYKDIEVV